MWIKHIPYEQADEELLELYNRVKGPDNNVDNIMLAHSLRPHTMTGHMQLYKNVLHHYQNETPTWFMETIGVWVSMLNGCHYCVDHHFAWLKRLLRDDERATQIKSALETNRKDGTFDGKEMAALAYATKLTRHPMDMVEQDIKILRAAGWDDGSILEINQVIAYFAYANRMVLGLGIDTAGDHLGLSPSKSSDPNAWNHQ